MGTIVPFSGPRGGPRHRGPHGFGPHHPGWRRGHPPYLVEIAPVTPLLRAVTIEVQKAMGGDRSGLKGSGPSLAILTQHPIATDACALLVAAGFLALAAQELGSQELAAHAAQALHVGSTLHRHPKKPSSKRAPILAGAARAIRAGGPNEATEWIARVLDAKATGSPGAASALEGAKNALSGWLDDLKTGAEYNPLNPFSPLNPLRAMYDNYTRIGPSGSSAAPARAPSTPSYAPSVTQDPGTGLAPSPGMPVAPSPSVLEQIKASPYAIPLAVAGSVILLAVVVSVAKGA